MIRHISFDLWLTLIKSNPLFKEKRAEFLAENFNPKGFSVPEVKNIVSSLDKACDRLNEKSGTKKKAVFMYRSVLKRLGLKTDIRDIKTYIDFDLVVKRINQLFFEYPPVLLNDSITNTLAYLKIEGYSLNISSNTGFIEGPFLRQFLFTSEIGKYFDFSVFSDEINASKPSKRFFECVHKSTSKKKSEILHIGDNYNADFLGASQYGFKAFLIENSEYSFELIQQAIDEKNRKF